MDQRQLLGQLLPQLAVVRGPDPRGEYQAWCPFHQDGKGQAPHTPNLFVSLRGWWCHVCKKGGSLKGLAKELGIDMPNEGASRIVATYDYKDSTGALLYQVVRYSPKAFRQRRPDGKGGWVHSLNGTPRVLYRLPDLLAHPGKPVFVVEGEKDADRLWSLGLMATTNAMGAEKWRDEYSASLQGRSVMIIPDNDAPGEKHARVVADSLIGKAAGVKILRLAELPQKGDVSDWLNAGHTKEELLQLAADAAAYVAESAVATQGVPEGTPARSQRPQADELLDLANAAGCHLLRDQRGVAFARFRAGDHWEIWPAASPAVHAWLTHLFHGQNDRAPNLTALRTAVNALDARARFEGRPVHLHNRVAWDGEAFCYDLCDARWRAVRITPDGWEMEQDPPPIFRRYGHQQAQVLPLEGGSLRSLFGLIPIGDEDHQALLCAHMVTALIPSISHPVLILYGPQGSSKTTASRMLRRLIDPSVAEAVGLPDKPEQLAQTLDHNWLPTFDNISSLPRWASDMLCRAATGEGLSKRSLYTDDEDFIRSFRRCSVLNGINVAAAQPDLVDRSILIGMNPITSNERRSEEEVWEEFEKLRPYLLGAMFTALSAAMREKPGIIPGDLPRMADFAHWGMAVAEGMGQSASAFAAAYDTNIRDQDAEVIGAHPLASVLVDWIERRREWTGNATELLGELEKAAASCHVQTKDRQWPRHPNHLTKKINELAANLRNAGIELEIDRAHGGRRITLKWIASKRDGAKSHRHGHRHAQPIGTQEAVTV